MIRGLLVWVDLTDASPPELGKRRPGVIVSNTEQNHVLSTVVVLPLSSRPPEIWPLRVRLPGAPAAKESYAVIPGVRQVSKERIRREIGRLDAENLDRVADALTAYLGD